MNTLHDQVPQEFINKLNHYKDHKKHKFAQREIRQGNNRLLKDIIDELSEEE